MAPPQGHASYRRQAGILAISKDRKSVSWTPAHPPDAAPSLVLAASNITNLQQTPETNPKVMLKVFTQDPGQTEPMAFVFTFSSPKDARAEANSIKDTLANVIQAQKSAQAAASASAGGQSAAMTIASAVSGAGRSTNIWEDDEKLKSDVKLQHSLMQENPELQRTFLEALSLKPESMTTMQFTTQFWASRVHLLRAHAIARNQGRGKTNVLSEIRREDGGSKLRMTQDQIRAIFELYPMMRTVYDDVVPEKCDSEVKFWSRFFQSQLYMKLRGLKFDPSREARDQILDVPEYLNRAEITGLRATSNEFHIPKFIDLEGNEEDHSQRQGNRPDTELRVTALDKAPLIRKLNTISEKIMATVRPSDTDASAPIGMLEADYEENLRLRDLAGDPEQDRIILNIRDQSRFFSDNRSGQADADGVVDTNPFRNLDPAKAVELVYSDISKHFSQPGVGAIPIDPYEEEEDEDLDDEAAPRAQTGSSLATKHIFSLIQSHRDQTSEIPEASGLSTAIYDRLTLTHATTIEFLHQFWAAFLSGDGSRAGEVGSLVESLNRSIDRINVIVSDAENERQAIIRAQERALKERFERTGRKHKLDYQAIGGGGQVVKELLGPILKSLANAVQMYKKAYEEQTRNLGEG